MQSSTGGRYVRPGDEPRRPSYDKIPTYFQLECSVCDRPLRILVQRLGQRITCGYCGCCFVAVDPTSSLSATSSACDSTKPLLAASSRDRRTQIQVPKTPQ